MSRGLGKIQTEVLDILRTHPRGMDTIELADRVYHGFRRVSKYHKLAKPKHEVAVRRALAGLAKKGLVIRLGLRPSGRFHIRRCHWRATRRRISPSKNP